MTLEPVQAPTSPIDRNKGDIVVAIANDARRGGRGPRPLLFLRVGCRSLYVPRDFMAMTASSMFIFLNHQTSFRTNQFTVINRVKP